MPMSGDFLVAETDVKKLQDLHKILLATIKMKKITSLQLNLLFLESIEMQPHESRLAALNILIREL